MKALPKVLVLSGLVAATLTLARIDTKRPNVEDLGIGVYNESAFCTTRPKAEVPAIGAFNEIATTGVRPTVQELGIGKHNENA